MSGWDTSSTPSWGSPDDPRDSAPSAPAPDSPSPDQADDRARGGLNGDSASAGPPPEFFGPEFAKPEFVRRTPGATLSRRELPSRDVPSRDVPSRDLTSRDVTSRDLTTADGPGPDRSGRGRHSAAPRALEASPRDVVTRNEPASDGPAGNGTDLARREPRLGDYVNPPQQPQPPEQNRPAPMAALSPDALDREHAARSDPALRDFFGARGGETRIDAPPASLPEPALPDASQPGYAGEGYAEQAPRRNESTSGSDSNGGGVNSGGVNGGGVNGSPWDRPARRPKTGPLAAAMTGPMMAVKGAASIVTPKEDERLLTKVLRFAGVGTVIVVALVVGIYLATHSTGRSPNATVAQQAHPQPTLGGGTGDKTSSPGAKASATATKSKKSKGKGKKRTKAAAKYTLSTPSTAGGFPLGQDPHFLATATATAQRVLSAVSLGGGGTASGTAVSASYRLPTAHQVITFVGYHGTFDPAKVIASMGSFGTTHGTYRDAKAGDSIACANTASSPAGAVCVWATASTIGVTEFFSETGPESLTASQDKGAADAAKIRASVETRKKS